MSMWRDCSRAEFDAFLEGLQFTTTSIVRQRSYIVDQFFVDVCLVARQHCDHGDITYEISHENLKLAQQMCGAA